MKNDTVLRPPSIPRHDKGDHGASEGSATDDDSASEGSDVKCVWNRHHGVYSSGHPGDHSTQYATVAEAKTKCRGTAGCRAVTCQFQKSPVPALSLSASAVGPLQHCTLRAGESLALTPGNASYKEKTFTCDTCAWNTHDNMYSSGHPGDHSTQYATLHEAKAKCLSTESCKAVTCAYEKASMVQFGMLGPAASRSADGKSLVGPLQHCTLRASGKLTPTPSDASYLEKSFICT